jgi:hypothetical protein
MKNIYLEDNDNIYTSKFKITFENQEDDEDVDFPDDEDINYCLDNSYGDLDEDNDYVAYQKKSTRKKVVFVVEVSNEETDEYMPSEDDLERVIEYGADIDESLHFYVEQTHRTISKAEAREEKLNKIGI